MEQCEGRRGGRGRAAHGGEECGEAQRRGRAGPGARVQDDGGPGRQQGGAVPPRIAGRGEPGGERRSSAAQSASGITGGGKTPRPTGK